MEADTSDSDAAVGARTGATTAAATTARTSPAPSAGGGGGGPGGGETGEEAEEEAEVDASVEGSVLNALSSEEAEAAEREVAAFFAGAGGGSSEGGPEDDEEAELAEALRLSLGVRESSPVPPDAGAGAAAEAERPLADGLARAAQSATLPDSAPLDRLWGCGRGTRARLLRSHGVVNVGGLRSMLAGLRAPAGAGGAEGEEPVPLPPLLAALLRAEPHAVSRAPPLTAASVAAEPLTAAAALLRSKYFLSDAYCASVLACMSGESSAARLTEALERAPLYRDPAEPYRVRGAAAGAGGGV
jgi:hypothetical protein